ncbi:M48 family metalloprotease [Anaeromyxobacter sp. Red801]|uniref:M48 family metalloprotease n=1 Tax=Anaeromyxobacter sp. Red801 TaxID=3411632 RepID=UPI003BA3493B
MDTERFERIAARFERRSRSSPRAYRALITALGALGFAVVGATVLGTVGLLALLAGGVVLSRNVVLLKLALPVGLTAAALLRAIWVKLERPEGERVLPGQAPALFVELERLRRLGRIPRIHAVRVDASLNAGVAQTPRLGILGWPHNDLVLGLPLMLSLSPESFQAVLAHELGHLSGRHGRAGAWIYRVRATWLRLLEALDGRRSVLARPLRAFFRWYGPFFGAASLALAREQEREADRFSAVAAGPRAAADALAAVAVAGWAVDRRFWPAMNRRTAGEAEPPPGYLGALEAEVHAALRDPGAGRALERALQRRSRGVDTHPALAERIAALGQPPRLPPAVFQTAAARFLGGALPALRASLDAAWSGAVRERWAAAHAQKAEQAARLAELERAAAGGPLQPDAAWERASLTEDLGDVPGAIALAREAVARHPEHAPARYGLGRLLLEQDEAEGVPLVEAAIALDGDAELPGAQLLAAYHLSTGRHDLAAPWIARAEALEGLHDEAAAERAQVLATDALEPHGLPPDAVEALVAPLRGHPRVKRLHLARKRLRHLPDRAPVFVLAVEPRWTWRQFVTGSAEASLPQALANALPDRPHTFVFVRGRSSGVLFRRVRKLAGARVA